MECALVHFTEGIFLTDYHGIKILIPFYIKTIENLILSKKNIDDEEHRNICERVFAVKAGHNPDDVFRIKKIVMISSMKIIKSVLFMGYSIGDMKLQALPDGSFSKTASQDLEIIRDNLLSMSSTILEKIRKTRISSTQEFLISEYYDLEFLHDLFSIAILQLYLECNQTTKKTKIISYSSTEEFVKVFLQQLTLDTTELPMDFITL
jgi:hypothetical protein